jgi:hypothetical protein
MYISRHRALVRLCAALTMALALLLLALGDGGPVLAATINVSTTADELNSDGDRPCGSDSRLNTNLAVDACTAGGSTFDTINLQAGTYTLSVAGRERTRRHRRPGHHDSTPQWEPSYHRR